MPLPSPLIPPTLRADLPVYPVHTQALRVTGATVPGPSGYASSSVLGPSIYVAFVQQLHPSTLLPRDREPCFVLDLNRFGLTSGYYTGRLAGSYQSLPIYEVGGAPITAQLSPNGLTPAQSAILATLSPAQAEILSNLTPCQLQTLLTAVPASQIHTLTSGVLTPTQLTEFIAWSTQDEFTSLYTQLTTSQIITLTTALNQPQIQGLIDVITPAQIQTVITSLTTLQLQNLASMPGPTIALLVTDLGTGQITIDELTSMLTVANVGSVPAYSTNFITKMTNVPTTGGTTALTGASPGHHTFTGTSDQTVQLPNVTTIPLGTPYILNNDSSGLLMVTTSSGATVGYVPSGAVGTFTSILTTGTTPASWGVDSSALWVPGIKSTATSGGTTALNTFDLQQQRFTGSANQTVQMPAVTGLPIGHTFAVINDSTGTVTVTSSGGNTIGTISAGTMGFITSVAISGTTAAAWSMHTTNNSTGGGGSGSSRTEGTLAATGSTQGDAAAIVTDAVVVSAADGTKGVILPNTEAAIIVIYNDAVSNLKVYPPSGAEINALGTNAAYSLATASSAVFYRLSSTRWTGATVI